MLMSLASHTHVPSMSLPVTFLVNFMMIVPLLPSAQMTMHAIH